MEQKDDSIKILEMRIRKQMNDTAEENLNLDNMQYYAMRQKRNLQQEIRSEVKEDSQQEIRGEVKENLQQEIHDALEKALQQQKSESESLQKADQTKQQDLSMDAEYIERAVRMPQMQKIAAIPVEKEVRHVKAKSGYEKVRRSLEPENPFGIKENYFFDIKG